MIAALLGLLLGLAIGIGCRWFDLPLPAPPRLTGALLVVTMTIGFLATDRVLSTRGEPIGRAAAAGEPASGSITHDAVAAPGAP